MGIENKFFPSFLCSTMVLQKEKDELKVYTMKEVALHNKAEDLWLVVEDLVYDVTKYVKYHPGGGVIATWAGRDATDVFRAYHPEFVYKKLPSFLIGRVDPQRTSEYEKDKQKLYQKVMSSDMLTTDWSFYKPVLIQPWLFLAASLVCVYSSSNFYMHMLGSFLMALFWHQSAWIGHDTLHNSIVPDRRLSHLIGVVYGNLVTGISAGWWKYTHNMHHCVTNEWDRDPDVTHMPLLAVTEKMFLDARAKKLGRIESVLVRYLVPIQHIMYVPYMAFARFNLYIQSLLFAFTGQVQAMPFQQMNFDKDIELYEKLGLIGFWAWYIAFLYFSFDTWQRSLAYMFFGHIYMGMLHVQITLSHWERPMSLPDDEHEWMRVQVVTSRNVDPGTFNDWYFGGLHYQIEHHLFPRVPRHNLGRLKQLVVPFCKKWDIPYTSSGFYEAVRDVVVSLSDVAVQVQLYEERNNLPRSGAFTKKAQE